MPTHPFGPTYSGSWRKLYTNFPQLKSLVHAEKRQIGCVAVMHSSLKRSCDRGMKLIAGSELAKLEQRCARVYSEFFIGASAVSHNRGRGNIHVGGNAFGLLAREDAKADLSFAIR